MSANKYKNMQNNTDSGLQLSIRAVRSILLYCKDWGDKALSVYQKKQSLEAGQTLCDSMVLYMINELPEKEQHLLMTIFTKTSYDMIECHHNPNKSLVENERALIRILDILDKKK